MHIPLGSLCLVGLAAASASPSSSAAANLTAEQAAWVRHVARGESEAAPFPAMSAPQAAAVDAAAQGWWTNFVDHHVAYNASVEVTYTDRSRATLTSYGDCGDSALWTGSVSSHCEFSGQLAAESHTTESHKNVHENSSSRQPCTATTSPRSRRSSSASGQPLGSTRT